MHAQVTLATETGNNTSACSAIGTPSYCSNAFAGLWNQLEPSYVQTYTADPSPGHVSTIPLNNKTNPPLLMYSGFNGQFLCEYQPWFYPGSSHSTTVNPGYDETNSLVVSYQDSKMIERGCAINFVDFYGYTDSSQATLLAITSSVSTDIESRGAQGYPLKFAILEDQGAFDGTGSTGCNRTGLSEGQTVDCIVSALNTDMDYINSHYVLETNGIDLQPGYWVDGYDNQTPRPVIGYFGNCEKFPVLVCPDKPGQFPGGDWNTIWTRVTAHVGSYAHPFKFVFQFGTFTEPQLAFGTSRLSAGEYGWPQPAVWDQLEETQLNWCSSQGPCSDYLGTFYCAATDESACSGQAADANQFPVGILYKGFDDTNAYLWGSNRVMAQQCGQVFIMDTAPEVGLYYGSGHGNLQIPYMQVATWNDYEEGAEVETGVDSCWRFNSPQVNSQTLTWTLQDQEPNGFTNYAKPQTIHHFTVWYANPNDPQQTLYQLATGIADNVGSLSNLNQLFQQAGASSGTYKLYVELVAMPMILNEMSPSVNYNYE